MQIGDWQTIAFGLMIVGSLIALFKNRVMMSKFLVGIGITAIAVMQLMLTPLIYT